MVSPELIVAYIRLRKEFIYLAVIMDFFTRCIRGW